MEAAVNNPASDTAFWSSHRESDEPTPPPPGSAVSVFSIIVDEPKSSATYDKATPKIRITAAIFAAPKIHFLRLDEATSRRESIKSVPAFVAGPVTMSATAVPAENPTPRSASARDTMPCSQMVMGRLSDKSNPRLAIDFATATTSTSADRNVTVAEGADAAAEDGGIHMEAEADTTTPRRTHTAADEKSSTEVLTNKVSESTMLLVL